MIGCNQENFTDEWVVQITKSDRHNNPVAGVVLFHGSEEEVSDRGEYREQNPNAEVI